MWDWSTGDYRYYAAPSALKFGEDPRPPVPKSRLRPPLGDPPERLLRELPMGAIYVGRGLAAKGEIVALGRRR